MTDDDLRVLERELARSGDVETRLRLVRALDRAARHDEALEHLLGADLADERVRAEIGRLPAWTHADGTPGRTRWTAAPPLRRTPRVRWWRPVTTLPFELPAHRVGHLLASPLALLYSELDGLVERLVALDPATGHVLWEREGPPVARCLAGDAFLEGTPVRAGFDLRSGRELWAAPPPGTGRWYSATEHVILAGEQVPPALSPATRVTALAHEEPRRPPTVAWSRLETPEKDWWVPGLHLVTRELVLLDVASSLVALDRRTGERRWSLPAALARADSSGVVVQERSGLTQLALDGTRVWTVPGRNRVNVLAPGYLIAAMDRGSFRIDRADGTATALPERPRFESAVGAQDVVTFVSANEDAIVACDATGVLWRIATEELPLASSVAQLVPGVRRLLVVTTRGRVVCLEEV